MIYDYIIIGAGPAGILAANMLRKHSRNSVLVLDAGRPLAERKCSGFSQNKCQNCSIDETCDVINGEGGTSALFGNKFCYFPASSGTLKLIPSDHVSTVYKYLSNFLVSNFHPELNTEGAVFGCRKSYNSDTLYSSKYREIICGLFEELKRSNVLRLKSTVTSITRSDTNTFTLSVNDSIKLKCRKLILASGRSSYSFLRKTFASLGLKYTDVSQDIGIRLEARSTQFTSEYDYQVDPKFRFQHENGWSSRTFCACNGGEIVPVKHGSSYYAEGVFLERASKRNNIAFLVRPPKPLASKELEKWCHSVNTQSPKGLLLGSIPYSHTTPSLFAEAIVNCVPVWPSEDYKHYLFELLKWALGEQVQILIKSKSDLDRISIYGPAIDRYWPVPEVKRGFGTSIRGLYVMGDATGLSRGILQSMMSGVAWAVNELGLQKSSDTSQEIETTHEEEKLCASE